MKPDAEWKADVSNDAYGMPVSQLTENECSDQIASLDGRRKAFGLSAGDAKRFTALRKQLGKLVRERLSR